MRYTGRPTRGVVGAASDATWPPATLHTDPANVASQRVAEKAGFMREGVLHADDGRSEGTRADAVVYSLLPQDLEPTHFANPA